MNTQIKPINTIKPNPSNPRVIKDDKFKKLVASIKEFPQMLQLRPIVCNADGVVLGGNMRLKACKAAGLTEVPVIYANDLTEEQQREFIVKDNVGFGEWDWEVLANQWDVTELNAWGLDLPELKIQEVDVSEMEDGAEIILDQAVQLVPKREYVVIMCNAENDEWETLKEMLQLKLVRRGGCKEGSAYEVHKGINRVILANEFIDAFRDSK
jgi:hypothetical protein